MGIGVIRFEFKGLECGSKSLIKITEIVVDAAQVDEGNGVIRFCLLYTSPSPRD